jgi:hypothetical protein
MSRRLSRHPRLLSIVLTVGGGRANLCLCSICIYWADEAARNEALMNGQAGLVVGRGRVRTAPMYAADVLHRRLGRRREVVAGCRPRRCKYYTTCCRTRPSTSWKTYIRNPSLFFISFSPSHLEGNDDGNHDPHAHICAWGVSFAKFLFLPSWFAKLLEVNFSCFAKII